MELKLVNNVTKHTFRIDNKFRGANGNYIVLDIILPNGMDDGEYTYTLHNDGELLSSGLLQIGGYKNTHEEYNYEENIIQYDGE